MKLLFKVVEATLVMVLASSRWWFIRLGSISSGWTGSGIASSWFVEVLQIVIIMMIIGSVIVGRMCQYLPIPIQGVPLQKGEFCYSKKIFRKWNKHHNSSYGFKWTIMMKDFSWTRESKLLLLNTLYYLWSYV